MEGSVKRRFSIAWSWPTVIVAFLVLGSVSTAAVAQTAAAATAKPAAAKRAATTAADASPKVSLATISVNGVNDIDPTKAFGSKSAGVTMEIFSDFQCPA